MQGMGPRKDKVWEIHRLNENRLQTMFFWMYELQFTKHCNDNGKIIYKKQIKIDLLQKLYQKYFDLSLVHAVTCAQ